MLGFGQILKFSYSQAICAQFKLSKNVIECWLKFKFKTTTSPRKIYQPEFRIN